MKAYNKLLDKDKKEIIDMYFKPENKDLSFYEMANILEVSERAFSRVLKENGVNTRLKNRYTLNENYFETIDTANKAYILGLLYSDGCLGRNNDIVLSFKIQSNIEAILNSIKKEMKLTKNVRILNNHKTGFPNNNSSYGIINFSSPKMWNDLYKLGLYPNKSLSLINLPILDENLYSHFLRGFFDGDGSVSKTLRKDRTYEVYRYDISFMGSKQLLSQIQNILVSKLPLKHTGTFHHTRTDFIKYITWSSHSDIKKIRNYLYQDAELFFQYKHDTLNELQ